MTDSSSKEIYQKSNQQVEKWSKFLKFALLNVTVHCMIWLTAIISYFTYFTTDLGRDSFDLPFYAWWRWHARFEIKLSLIFEIFDRFYRYPFDWRKPFGYIIAVTCQYIEASYFMYILLSLSILIIGTYWMLTSIIQDIKEVLLKVNSEKCMKDLLNRFAEFVQLYAETKQ